MLTSYIIGWMDLPVGHDVEASFGSVVLDGFPFVPVLRWGANVPVAILGQKKYSFEEPLELHPSWLCHDSISRIRKDTWALVVGLDLPSTFLSSIESINSVLRLLANLTSGSLMALEKEDCLNYAESTIADSVVSVWNWASCQEPCY
jgi:hypothetical protein